MKLVINGRCLHDADATDSRKTGIFVQLEHATRLIQHHLQTQSSNRRTALRGWTSNHVQVRDLMSKWWVNIHVRTLLLPCTLQITVLRKAAEWFGIFPTSFRHAKFSVTFYYTQTKISSIVPLLWRLLRKFAMVKYQKFTWNVKVCISFRQTMTNNKSGEVVNLLQIHSGMHCPL